MKPTLACTALLLACLSGPALTETATASGESCNLTGHPSEGDSACKATRLAYRQAVSDCMAQLEADGKARRTTTVSMSSHSYRARYLLCDDEVRATVGK